MSPDELRRRRLRRVDIATLEHLVEFERQRDMAQQHDCDPPPLGCEQPAGHTCTVIGHPGIPLGRQPAHLCRLRKAGLAAPSTIPTPRPESPIEEIP